MTEPERPAAAGEPETAPASTRPAGASPRPAIGAAREVAEEPPWIEDRASKVWVLLIVVVFSAIFLFGLLFGQAGLLTPAPASPDPAASPIVSPSPAGSPSPAPSPTESATPVAS